MIKGLRFCKESLVIKKRYLGVLSQSKEIGLVFTQIPHKYRPNYLRNSKGNSSLTIELDSQNINQKVSHHMFSSALHYTKTLTNLTIIAKNCDCIDNASLAFIFNYLKHCKGLKRVEISFLQCRYLTDSGLKSLSYFLHYLTSLKTLEISFEGYNNFQNGRGQPISNVRINSIAKAIRTTKSLKNLIISIPNSRTNEKGLTNLMPKLGRIQGLENLWLDLSAALVTDTTLTFFGETINRLEGLRKLKFCMNSCNKFGYSGLQAFMSSLPRNKSLTDLRLTFFNGLEIKESCLSIFLENLSEMKSLKRFGLDLWRCVLSWEELDLLRESLKHTKVLASLEWNKEYSFYISRAFSKSFYNKNGEEMK